MAVINFFNEMFGDPSYTIEKETCLKIKDVAQEYLDTLPVTEEFEVYNVKTGTTELLKADINKYSLIIIVNGEESSLDYEIQKDDVISVWFTPKNWNQQDAQVFKTIGDIAFSAGNTIFAVGTKTHPIVMAIGGTVATIGLALDIAATVTLNKFPVLPKTPDEDPISQDTNLPYIAGSSNTSQVGNRYMATLGKHLISPYIVGSPYHVTKTKDMDMQRDGGQWLRVLYCAGYGPLKLTHFKLGDSILAHNESSVLGKRDTVMHGQLNTYDTDSTPGDFTITWKNNDVKMEILQAGDLTDTWPVSDSVNDKYGTIYPSSVNEKEIGADILFAYDKLLSTTSAPVNVLYYNKVIPSGWRTNSVRFSSNCPLKLEVELDMSNGIWGMKIQTILSGIEKFLSMLLFSGVL